MALSCCVVFALPTVAVCSRPDSSGKAAPCFFRIAVAVGVPSESFLCIEPKRAFICFLRYFVPYRGIHPTFRVRFLLRTGMLWKMMQFVRLLMLNDRPRRCCQGKNRGVNTSLSHVCAIAALHHLALPFWVVAFLRTGVLGFSEVPSLTLDVV